MASWNTNSRNCDVMLTVTEMSSDVLPLCYVTWDNSRKDVRRCEKLHVIVRTALRTVVCNNYRIIRLFIERIIAGYITVTSHKTSR